jgi:hypothetical protein
VGTGERRRSGRQPTNVRAVGGLGEAVRGERDRWGRDSAAPARPPGPTACGKPEPRALRDGCREHRYTVPVANRLLDDCLPRSESGPSGCTDEFTVSVVHQSLSKSNEAHSHGLQNARLDPSRTVAFRKSAPEREHSSCLACRSRCSPAAPRGEVAVHDRLTALPGSSRYASTVVYPWHPVQLDAQRDGYENCSPDRV